MVMIAALITGLFSTFVLISLAIFIAGPSIINAAPFPQLTLAIVLTVWLGSAYLLMKGTSRASVVWARGGLLGAIEWLLVGLAMLGSTVGYFVKAVEQDPSPTALGGLMFASGLMTTIGLGVVLFMALCSLTVWFVAKKSQTEFTPTEARRSCIDCGESIPAIAKKCRFCGAPVSVPS